MKISNNAGDVYARATSRVSFVDETLNDDKSMANEARYPAR